MLGAFFDAKGLCTPSRFHRSFGPQKSSGLRTTRTSPEHSGPLALPPHSPERSQPEPGKGHGAANCNRQPSAAHPPGMIFPVFLDRSAAKTQGHHEEDNPRNLKPQLVQRAPERACRGTDGAHDGAERAAAARLVPCNPRYDACPSPGRNFAHGLDFNSLRRYNDATRDGGEPFRGCPHLI